MATPTEPPRGVRWWPVLAVVVASVVASGVVVVAGVRTLVDRPSPDRSATGQLERGASADGFTVWDVNDDGDPVRWDPCSPVELVVATQGAPDGARADLDRAIDEVAEATGLDLRVVGVTDERPAVDRPAYQPDRYGQRWAPVLVAWAEPREGELNLASTDRGIAMPVAVGAPGDRTYVTGQVALNRARDDLVVGFDDRATSWGSTLLHELAHLVGLGHVDDADELMHVHPGDGPVAFGPGDLAGLAAVGAAQGCRDVPAPQHVEVADPP
jgi:hypothetical protein